MKEGWRMVKLGEVCDTSAGGTPSKLHKEYYENGNIPWMLSGEVCHKYIYDVEHYITQEGLNNSSAKLFPENTVVVAMYGATAGQVGILKLETSTNQAVCGILPNDNILPEYLYYYFLYYKDLLVAQAVGNAQPNISQQKIKSVEFPFLSIEEQHRIVSILDASFEKIDALKKNAEENLKNAKALFQQVLAQELKPKEGWVEKKLGEVSSVRIGPFGSLLHKKDYIIGGTPLVNPVHMKNGVIYMDDNFTVSKEKEIELNNYILRTNDIVFARRGEIGRCALVTEKENGYLCGTGSLFVRFIEKVNSRFMLLMFQSAANKQYLIDNASGATMLNINSDIVMNMPICLPEIEEQHRIVQTLDTLSEKCRRLEEVAQQTIRECDALKQSILRQAFSGKL